MAKKSNAGRPTVMTPEVISILEESLMSGFTIAKSCYIAKISEDSYYNKQSKDKKFSDKMERAKRYAEEVARNNVVEAIKGKDISTSKWYLERKAKDEFGTRTEITGADGTPITINTIEFIDGDDDGNEESSNQIS